MKKPAKFTAEIQVDALADAPAPVFDANGNPIPAILPSPTLIDTLSLPSIVLDPQPPPVVEPPVFELTPLPAVDPPIAPVPAVKSSNSPVFPEPFVPEPPPELPTFVNEFPELVLPIIVEAPSLPSPPHEVPIPVIGE